MNGNRYDPGVRDITAIKKLAGASNARIQEHLVNKTGSRSSIYRWSKLYRQTGSATRDKSTYKTRGRPRQLSHVHTAFLHSVVARRPDINAETVADLFLLRFDAHLNKRSLYRYFERGGITFKRLDKRALEADPAKEAEYLFNLSHHHAEQFICLDETHINDKTVNGGSGWSPEGTRAIVHQKLQRGVGYSAMVVLTWQGLFGVPVIQGAYNVEETLNMLYTYVVL